MAELQGLSDAALSSLIQKHVKALEDNQGNMISAMSPGVSTIAQGLLALLEIRKMKGASRAPAPASNASGGASQTTRTNVAQRPANQQATGGQQTRTVAQQPRTQGQPQ